MRCPSDLFAGGVCCLLLVLAHSAASHRPAATLVKARPAAIEQRVGSPHHRHRAPIVARLDARITP